MKKLLLIRLDKIGDLVCTLCVDQIPTLANYETHWIISKGLGFIPDHARPQRNYTEFVKDRDQDPRNREKFLQFLKEHKPDIAVSFQAPWWVNFMLWKAGVSVRAGVHSQWHSFLFLNKGLRQKRSLAVKHEADYNRELLEFALDLPTTLPTPILKMKAKENHELLVKFSLQEKSYAVVHPGMAGSALNWPIKRYIEFIEKKIETKKVVLNGTLADEKWLTDLKNHFDKDPRVISLQGKLNNEEMLTILEKAEMVLAPSTGIAHLAASLGTKVVAIYSPVKVQHPRRWAARGDQVKILVPQLTESQLKSRWDPEQSMATISAQTALEA
jgi:heptosyltransferase I